MNTFIELLRESVIVQGIITVTFCGAWAWMKVHGTPTDSSLDQFVGLVLGFYFGGKVQAGIAAAQRDASAKKDISP